VFIHIFGSMSNLVCVCRSFHNCTLVEASAATITAGLVRPSGTLSGWYPVKTATNQNVDKQHLFVCNRKSHNTVGLCPTICKVTKVYVICCKCSQYFSICEAKWRQVYFVACVGL